MMRQCVVHSPNKPQLQVGCNRMCQTSGCRASYSGWQTSPTSAKECACQPCDARWPQELSALQPGSGVVQEIGLSFST
jgi:hypothetical protein